MSEIKDFQRLLNTHFGNALHWNFETSDETIFSEKNCSKLNVPLVSKELPTGSI